MHRLLVALALLVLAPSAQAFDVSNLPNTTWVNKRGSTIEIKSTDRWQYPGGYYTSNEWMMPESCRNIPIRLEVLTARDSYTPWWLAQNGLTPPPGFDIEMRTTIWCPNFERIVGGDQQTVWFAPIVERPLRLCMEWWSVNNVTRVVTPGKDVFWPVPRRFVVKRSSCPPPTRKVVIRPTPKNYPVWPPFPLPIWR